MLVIVFIVLASQSQSQRSTYSPLPANSPSPSPSSKPLSQPPSPQPAPSIPQSIPAVAPPTPTPEPTLTPKSSTVGYPPESYRVVGISSDDALNVRSDPGVRYPKITQWNNATSGIRIAGGPEHADNATWYNVERNGVKGWVNGMYITAAEYGIRDSSHSQKIIQIPSGYHLVIHASPRFDAPAVGNVPNGAYSVDIDESQTKTDSNQIRWLQVTIYGYKGWVTERGIRQIER